MREVNNFSEGFKAEDLNCPECGSPMEMVFSLKYRYPNGRRRPMYQCIRYPECKGHHGAHPNGAPLGVPASKETRQLRIKVHAELDRIFPPRMIGWREVGRHTRKEKIYNWLAQKGFGHVSSMDSNDCQKILKLISTSYPQS